VRLRVECGLCFVVAACASGEGARVNDGGSGDETFGSATSSPTVGDPEDDGTGTLGTDDDGTGLTVADDDEGNGPAECGNGQLDPGEMCDDDNEVEADGCNTDCMPSGYVTWQETIGSGAAQVDEGFAVVADIEGNFYVGGYLGLADGTVDGWLRRLSPTGGTYWTVPLQGAAARNDAFQALALADGDGAYAAGYTGATDMTSDAIVRKIDRFGAEQWSSTFDAPGATNTVIARVATDPDGSLIVVGHHDTMANGNDLLVRKYTPDGMPVWTRSYDGPAMGNDYGYGVAVANDGYIYVTGSEATAGEGANMWLGRYDTDGNLIWARSYNGLAGLDDYLLDVDVDPETNAYVCGYSAAVEYPWHVFVRRYDPDGELQWTDEYPGPTTLGAHCNAIARDVNGDLVITGGEMRDDMGMPVRDILVRKYDQAGGLKWSVAIPGGALGPDYGRDVFVGDDMTIYATGSIDTGADVRDIWMARLTP
jgi:cysteine-rich repeat protein